MPRLASITLLAALTGCGDGTFVRDLPEADTEVDTEAVFDTEADSDSEVGSDTGVDTDVDTDSDAGTDADTEPDTDADTEPDTDNDTEPDVDTEPDTEPDVDTEPDTEPDVDTDPDEDTDPDTWVFQFNGMTNPSCIEEHAQILRLYQSFLGRAPDVSGANYWLSEFTYGDASMAAIQAAFGASTEFQTRYGGLSNGAFIDEVYDNVLGRPADSEGHAYWTGLLDRNENTRVEVIGFISNSPEFIARTPYEASPFCAFIDDHASGYIKNQVAPGTVWMRSPDGNVNVLYIDWPSGGSFRVPPGTTRRVTGHYGGTAAVNGNWFGFGSDYFSGYSISDGTVRGAINNDYRMAYIGEDVFGSLLFGHYADIGGAVPPSADNLVSGQTLVVGGARWAPTTTNTGDPTFTNAHPRTAAGVTAEGYVILTVIDGRSMGPGMTGTQTADLLIGLGSERGLMLDGGGSSAMFIDGDGIVNQPSDGSTRSVANQLIFQAPSVWIE